MVQAFQAGLDGLCLTAMNREALIKALELVMLGETFIASALALSLWDEASRQRQARPDGAVSLTLRLLRLPASYQHGRPRS